MKTIKPVYITDIFGEIVTRVESKLLSGFQELDNTIVGINYEYGPYKEVFGNLVQKTKNNITSVKKYPLVWLVLPIVERHGSEIGIYATEPIRIIIGRWGNNTDKTPTRYEKNFKRFLYPIYLELLKQIDLDPRFLTQSSISLRHTKTDWPYWGGDNPGENENQLSDFVDVIEISNLELKLNLKHC